MGEFQLAFSKPYMQEYLKAIDVNPDEAETLFKVLDLDGSGHIDYDEFVHGCLRLKGNAKAIDFFTLQHDQKLWMRQANQMSQMLDDLQKRTLWMSHRMSDLLWNARSTYDPGKDVIGK